MANLNPLQLMAMLRGGNPQQIVQQIIQQNYPNNPMMQQLLNLGQQGDVQSYKKLPNKFVLNKVMTLILK